MCLSSVVYHLSVIRVYCDKTTEESDSISGSRSSPNRRLKLTLQYTSKFQRIRSLFGFAFRASGRIFKYMLFVRVLSGLQPLWLISNFSGPCTCSHLNVTLETTLWFNTPVTSSNKFTEDDPISVMFGLENRQRVFSLQVSKLASYDETGYQLCFLTWQ